MKSRLLSWSDFAFLTDLQSAPFQIASTSQSQGFRGAYIQTMLHLFSKYKLLVLGSHSAWANRSTGTLRWWYLLPNSESQKNLRVGSPSAHPGRGSHPCRITGGARPLQGHSWWRDTHPLYQREATPLVSTSELHSHGKVCTLKAPSTPAGVLVSCTST